MFQGENTFGEEVNVFSKIDMVYPSDDREIPIIKIDEPFTKAEKDSGIQLEPPNISEVADRLRELAPDPAMYDYLYPSVEALYRFLAFPLKIDPFTSHEDRRNWRLGLSPQDRRAYEDNRLRLIHIGYASSQLANLGLIMSMDPELSLEADQLEKLGSVDLSVQPVFTNLDELVENGEYTPEQADQKRRYKLEKMMQENTYAHYFTTVAQDFLAGKLTIDEAIEQAVADGTLPKIEKNRVRASLEEVTTALYDKLTTAEKVEVVRKFTLAAVTGLHILANKPLPERNIEYLFD